MTLVLGEWRESKVRPIPGNAPHDRPVSRGIVSSKSIGDDSFRTTRFPQRHRKRRSPRRAFFEAWRNLSVRCGSKTKPEPGSTASRRSAPTQVEERVGRTTLFSSSAMSSGRLFLDRVGRHQSPSPLHRHTHINMHSSEPGVKGDISLLKIRPVAIAAEQVPGIPTRLRVGGKPGGPIFPGASLNVVSAGLC